MIAPDGSDRVQHVNVKIFAEEPAPSDLTPAIQIFHRWIRENGSGELLVDVADYTHVPDGPGVVLIGHEANCSLDCAAGRLGLLYNRKAPSGGGFPDRLLQAFRAALLACRRLEAEPEFAGSLKFNGARCEVTLNDRLLAPNSEETWLALKPDFESVLASLFRNTGCAMDRLGEPRERFRIGVSARSAVSTDSLLGLLNPV